MINICCLQFPLRVACVGHWRQASSHNPLLAEACTRHHWSQEGGSMASSFSPSLLWWVGGGTVDLVA